MLGLIRYRHRTPLASHTCKHILIYNQTGINNRQEGLGVFFLVLLCFPPTRRLSWDQRHPMVWRTTHAILSFLILLGLGLSVITTRSSIKPYALCATTLFITNLIIAVFRHSVQHAAVEQEGNKYYITIPKSKSVSHGQVAVFYWIWGLPLPVHWHEKEHSIVEVPHDDLRGFEGTSICAEGPYGPGIGLLSTLRR